MSQPEHQSIVNEIRSARVVASPELRARVRAIAAAEVTAPTAGSRRTLPWRRLAVVLVPAGVAVAAAAALAIGLSGSGGGGPKTAVRGVSEASTGGSAFDQAAPKVLKSPAGGALPATAGRAQLYEAELTLKVGDLSAATKRTLRLTRDFHGYVRSVRYGSGAERGSATVVVRVPVGSVQEAIVRFSAIGRILDQQVSIQDVQPRLDARFRAMQAQRDVIAKLQARLQSPSLSPAERAALEDRLVAARRQLVVLQRSQAALQRQASYATVSLSLESKSKPAIVPAGPGRIGRALHRSGQILADEAKVLLYVLIVGAPFFVLGAVAFGGLQLRRRRNEERLLSTS